MLDTAELERMRAVVDQTLPDTATIRVRTLVTDGGGGQTESFAGGSSVACRLSPITGGEPLSLRSIRHEQVDDRTTHILTLPDGTTIAETDRVVVAGVTYEVTYVRDRKTWELCKRVELREL